MNTPPASPAVMSRFRPGDDPLTLGKPPAPRVLSLVDIVNAPHTVEDVKIPEFPDAVFRIRSLSSDELMYYQGMGKRMSDEGTTDFCGVRETLIAMALVDGAGASLWANLNHSDPATFASAKMALGKMPSKTIDTLFEAVQEHNGMNANSDDVEGLAGN